MSQDKPNCLDCKYRIGYWCSIGKKETDDDSICHCFEHYNGKRYYFMNHPSDRRGRGLEVTKEGSKTIIRRKKR